MTGHNVQLTATSARAIKKKVENSIIDQREREKEEQKFAQESCECVCVGEKDITQKDYEKW